MKKKSRSFLLRLSVCVFAMFIAVTLFSQMAQLKRQREQLADVKSQITQTQGKIADIKRILAENDQQFMENVARDDLDYAKPNERIYVDASGN